MSKTAPYREQHTRLLDMVKAISAHLHDAGVSRNAEDIRSQLSLFMGLLKVHLAMEDKSLYPALLKSPDAKLRTMAQKFIDEMGAIGGVLQTYQETWTTPQVIRNNRAKFIADTKSLLNSLINRIDRENNELYRTFDES